MKAILLVTTLTLIAAPAAARDWSATGPRGNSVAGSGGCATAGATLTCNRTGVMTGSQGLSLDRSVARVSDRSATVKTLTTTGPQGRSVTSTRSRSRSPRG